jgi:ubiquinone/menaquinone biosynthesis C-methylase UbiE
MSQAFAKWYDLFMRPLEQRKFKKIRSELLKKANGRVLELGSGTGINFPFYQDAFEVIAIEPNQHMISRSIPKVKLAMVPIEIIRASAEQLPFADNSFDTVVATLVFCTIPNPEKAIREIKRVCKPEGTILLFEHVKMENQTLSKLQDILTPAWRKICDGCCLNRNTINTFENHGFTTMKKEKFYKDLFITAELRQH